MSTIWIVTNGWYEDYTVLAAFADKFEAQSWASAWTAKQDPQYAGKYAWATAEIEEISFEPEKP